MLEEESNMDSEEASAIALASYKVEQYLKTLHANKQDLAKRRILYIPPHRRNAQRTVNTDTNSFHKLLETAKDISLPKASFDKIMKNKSFIAEIQSSKLANEVQQKECLSSFPKESRNEENFSVYDTASDNLTSESTTLSTDRNEEERDIAQPLTTEKDTFDSNIKPSVVQSCLAKCDEKNNLSISIPNIRMDNGIVEERNKTNDCQSIHVTNNTSNVDDYVKKANSDDATILHRILNLANTHVNVTFKTMLSDLYLKRYNEHIPLNILLELNFLVEIDNDFLKPQCVTPTNEKGSGEKNHFTSFQVITSGPKALNAQEINGGPSNPECIILENGKSPDGEKYYSTSLQVVDDEPRLLNVKDIGTRFPIKIYNCKFYHENIEIWGKIMHNSNVEKLDKLLKEMTIFYDSEKFVPPYVKDGGFYAVFKDGFWHRVKCVNRDEFNAVVLFIDRGDEFTVSLTNVYKLHDKFISLPAQAIKMKLSDLGVFSDCCEAIPFLSATLKERIVYATSFNLPNQDEIMCWDVKMSYNIYEENVDVADLIIEQLLKTSLKPEYNCLNEEMIHIYISCITENGVFIQLVDSESSKYFHKLFRNILTNYIDNGKLIQPEINLSKDKIYLVQNPFSKAWFRAKILTFVNEEVEAILIDNGLKICYKKESFILLEKLSSVFAKYPKQAIEVRVHGLSSFSGNINAMESFSKLVFDTKTFYASFVQKTLDKNNIPIIRLFKKAQDNSLTPINDGLLLNQESEIRNTSIISVKKVELSNDTISLRSQMSKMRELQRSMSLTSLSTVLDPPRIPKKSYFDVHVVQAENPSNFVIQLFMSKSEFKKLEYELSDACDSYNGPQFSIGSLRTGQLYAAKYDGYDHKWYRVYLIDLNEEEETAASVYYCDYGYYKDVSVENLVPLETQFHQLPYQAIWAELYGIKPVFNRWTVDDAWRFKDLTQQKNFVCLVKKKVSFIPKDNEVILLPVTVETVYSLELIDTSTKEDIDIADVLVNERRAERQ